MRGGVSVGRGGFNGGFRWVRGEGWWVHVKGGFIRWGDVFRWGVEWGEGSKRANIRGLKGSKRANVRGGGSKGANVRGLKGSARANVRGGGKVTESFCKL